MIRFGPSGNGVLFYEQGNKTTEQIPKWLNAMGLNAYEYSFGRGINLSEQTATKLRQQADIYEVQISVHAPYYINFANPDDAMVQKSYNYVINSAIKLKQLGGERVVFHPASLGKATRDEAVELTKQRLNHLLELIYDNKLDDLYFCPETMGKINQIGSLDEIIDFCKLDKVFIPTIDFGHLNARTMGGIKTEQDYEDIITSLIDGIGIDKVRKMHVHFSKIEYSKGGEVKHLTMDDMLYGPNFEPLAKVIKKHQLEPVILSESAGTQAQDALKMKKYYNEVI